MSESPERYENKNSRIYEHSINSYIYTVKGLLAVESMIRGSVLFFEEWVSLTLEEVRKGFPAGVWSPLPDGGWIMYLDGLDFITGLLVIFLNRLDLLLRSLDWVLMGLERVMENMGASLMIWSITMTGLEVLEIEVLIQLQFLSAFWISSLIFFLFVSSHVLDFSFLKVIGGSGDWIDSFLLLQGLTYLSLLFLFLFFYWLGQFGYIKGFLNFGFLIELLE